MNISILDILSYLKKHTKIIIILVIIAGIMAQLYYRSNQTYVATTTVKYTFANAEKGLNLNGGKLDVNEMTAPIVIGRVIKDLNLNASVEKIRSAITISPFIDATTKKKQEALTEKGEDFEYFPTEYTISYKYSGRLSAGYGVMVLNKLLQEYDNYVRETYTSNGKIADTYTELINENYDYMEICDLFNSQMNNSITVLAGLYADNEGFRSAKTGLTFDDLKKYFENLHSTEYMKLYSVVRTGCLSKNKEVLLKNYNYQIEQLQLTSKKRSEEARISFDIMKNFYAKYKEGKTTNVDSTASDNSGTDKMGADIVVENDLTKMLTTYDEIITAYVDSGVETAKADTDINYYKTLIDAYQNDSVPQEQKEALQKEADAQIEKIGTILKTYVSLANETLNDYNVYKGTQYMAYLSSVGTQASLSRSVTTLFGIFLGGFAGIVIALGIELLKRVKEEAILEEKRKKLALIESGVLPDNMGSMSAMDRALFNAVSDDFKEFSLHYQPIVDKSGEWVGAEALVRWESPEFGTIMPGEFIAIAEKYDIMEILGKWILKEACKTCKKWNKTISPDLFVCINFTLSQIGGTIFMDEIFRTLNDIAVNPKNILLEISNGGEIDDVDTISKKLLAIKTFGVRISLDNFGSEKSSVEALYKLPIDIVKIEMEYISELLTDANKQNFVNNIINIASIVGFKVCAEGVEKADVASTLYEVGADYQQGYYYSRPISESQFEVMLKSNIKSELV